MDKESAFFFLFDRSRAPESYANCSMTAFTAAVVKRTEVHAYVAVLVGTVAYAEQNYVALVALNVLEVLDEDRFFHLEGLAFEVGVLGQFVHQHIFD